MSGSAKKADQLVHLLELLLAPSDLVDHGLALVDETAELLVDSVEASIALGRFRFVQGCALALFPLQLQLLTELLEPLRAHAPQMAELEVNHGVRSGQGIDQEPLESLELLLRANDRALLLLELIEQLETLAAERLELALHARAVPIELEQLLCGFGALLLE